MCALEKGTYYSDTANHSGLNLKALMAHEQTMIASATSLSIAGSLALIPLAPGQTWFGHFTQFQLASGSVTAYDANP